MKQLCCGLFWGLAVLAVLLSPILLIFSIPLALGVGLDIFDVAGETPVVLALCAPLAIAVLWRTLPRQRLASFCRARLHLSRATTPRYAP